MVGLSLGGAIAAQSMAYYSNIYDRAILMAPFFDFVSFNKILVPTLEKLSPDKEISWGEQCDNERGDGKGGYCNFKVANLMAVRDFGLQTLKQVKKISKPVQIVGVEEDKSASNESIALAGKNINKSKICLLEKGTKHAMISRFDNIGSDMFWLDPLKQQMIEFAINGTPFKEVKMTKEGIPMCKSRI
jgi:esterase/lipase